MAKANNLLFLTNFSEACFQAIPTVAEWIDWEEGNLTLLHVHAPGQLVQQRAQKAMRAFFAEADRYARCQRVLLEGDPAKQVVEYCRRMVPDIVFAPASNPSGFPKIAHKSLRAALVRTGGVRIWTRGRLGQTAPPRRRVENIAYVVTGHADWAREAELAAKSAARHDAKLHLIHLTPVQSIHDGTFASEIRVGTPGVPTEDLIQLAQSLPVSPMIHSSPGDEYRELPRLLNAANPEIVFLGERHAVQRTLFGATINPALDRAGREVICFPSHPVSAVHEEAALQETGRFILAPDYR